VADRVDRDLGLGAGLQGGVADALLARARVAAVPLARVGEDQQPLPQGAPLLLAEHVPLEVHGGEQLGVRQQHLRLAEEQVAALAQGEVERASTCAWVSEFRYIRVLRQTSRSIREMGASWMRSWRPKTTDRRSSLEKT
jgi:hypothetical protein